MEAALQNPTRTKEVVPQHKQVTQRRDMHVQENRQTLAEKELLEEVSAEVVKYYKSIPDVMDQKVLYLSNIKHYIFDADTLFDVNTIINLRLLNRISHIYYFLYNTNRLLPLYGYYLGCFESHHQTKRRLKLIRPKIAGSMIYVLSYFFDDFLPKIPVIRNIYLWANGGRLNSLSMFDCVTLLSKNGFLLTNSMTINNIEYFVAKKVKTCKKENLGLLTLLFDYKHHSKIVKL